MTETPASVPVRHVVAVVVGNALEFYDFLTYAFFAVYIGRTFFPSESPTASLLASLGAFGAGFVTRPIGGLVIGRMGVELFAGARWAEPNVDQLRERMRHVFTHAQESRQKAMRGRAEIVASWDWERIIQNHWVPQFARLLA